VSRAHHRFALGLGFVGIGIGGAFAWAVTLPTGFCGRYPPPSNLIDGLFLLLGFGLLFGASMTAAYKPTRTRIDWILAGVSVIEAAAAFGLVAYLAARFGTAYDCG
jgi:hypothetical protein